ncbi:ead/Ea22-like family protein [Serratia marcescens]|uniref:ead/Ea22-like family protein n=1 Tax=Serratia marcescens TaxID=615 RepID=UPI001A2DD2C8|nr:ead/Ea22-like family protein [Serratia marcescens]MBI6135990.1 ead/Ea22-like family protein [Serratia marcescens]
MDKFSELKAAAMAATPGRIGDRIDGSGSIKYECTGYDGSLVLRTDHKDMEYGFVGDNADADELFFRLCVPDVVLTLLAELEAKDKRIAELESQIEDAKASVDGGPAAWSWTGYPNRQHLTRFEPEGWKNPRDMSPLYSRQQMAGLVMMNNELRKKLATPVRLLGEMLVHDWEHRVERQAAFEHRKIAWDARLAEDKKAILAAGFTFTVDGEEQ